MQQGCRLELIPCQRQLVLRAALGGLSVLRRGRRLILKRNCQYVFTGRGEVEFDVVEDVFGDVVGVFAVAVGQDHVIHAGPVGGEHLLRHPADRQDTSPVCR